jgi:hypothetical protein
VFSDLSAPGVRIDGEPPLGHGILDGELGAEGARLHDRDLAYERLAPPGAYLDAQGLPNMRV